MTPKQKEIVQALKNLVSSRFSFETLNAKLSEIFNEEIKVADVSSDDNECSDYNLLFESKTEETYGYFDIYYLKMRNIGWSGADMYITEISYEFEAFN